MKVETIFRYATCFCMGALVTVIGEKLSNDGTEQFIYTVMLAIVGLYFLVHVREKK